MPMLSGTFSVVNSGPGDQTNPHVDCNLAPYTNDDFFGSSTIHWFDFSTNTDHVIPPRGQDSLSDVSGPRIAFTEASSSGDQVVVFDTASLTRTPVPGNRHSSPAIGGTLVAFEDRSFSGIANESEISVYDLAASASIRLTNDLRMDKNAAVSPNGDIVVWEKCDTSGFNCDIWMAAPVGPGTFSTAALTSGSGEEHNPDTNGSIVVYTSLRGGETDVYFQPVGGGPETQLAIPGDQRDVSISGNLIAFESQVGTEYDIFVYAIDTGTLYRVTDTPVDETLNDVSVCGTVGRIVYAAPSADYDVFAFTFTTPEPPPPSCTPADPAAACADPSKLTLLADLTVTRGTAQPDTASTTFSSPEEGGLVCITNSRATSGAVEINGSRAVGPSAFEHEVTSIAVRVSGLGSSSDVTASIAGQPGTSYEVKVYAEPPSCRESLPRHNGLWRPGDQLVMGERLTVLDGRIRMSYDLNEPLAAGAMGCSATSGLALSSLAVLALWLASRRRPQPVRVRRP
ncbi:MAG TPA: hypothetical protein VND93_09050 [Myxococcales bacterium]|nr:hypothetical protein [Myxococcales bacterium]